MHSAVDLRDVLYSWPGSNEPVLDVPKLSIAKGASIFLLGPSGSGKSTLLNLIAGLALPQSGSVSVLGQKMQEMNSRARDRFRARNIGLIFQQFNLVPYLDVETNIRLAARLAGTRDDECERRGGILMESLLLSRSLLKHRTDELSVGQQQRVAIVRAMINKPQLIIADEPTSALDEESRLEFVETLLSTQKSTSATVIFVSHDRSLARYFDSVESMRMVNVLQNRKKSNPGIRSDEFHAN